MWETFVEHKNIESIMHDKGLAKVGDGLVNFCYSLAKSLVLGHATGEKVRDSVLARAIRSTSVYQHMNRRTDAGRAGDAYEAIMAYLWMTEKISISDMVDSLSELLDITSTTSRKKEGEIAAIAFQKFLESNIEHLP
ncbi:MAG: ribonuclease III family protein [Candidatus Thorarchaeota archaeon]